MLRPIYTKRFEKDIKRLQKQNIDLKDMKNIIRKLIFEEPLDENNKDHKLIGNYVGRRECHIKPDWLLIYKIKDDSIIFERSGSHSELFN